MNRKLFQFLLVFVLTLATGLSASLACACSKKAAAHECCQKQTKPDPCHGKLQGKSRECCGKVALPRATLQQATLENVPAYFPVSHLPALSFSLKILPKQNLLACSDDEDHPPDDAYIKNHSLLL